MTHKSKLSAPTQTALGGLGIALSAGLLFLTLCLCSAATVRSMAILLILLTLAAAFLFYGRLRDRLKPPILALALMVAMDGVSCFYAVSGKFALFELLKVLAAFCLALLLLMLVGGNSPERRLAAILEGCCAIAGLVSIDLLSTRLISTPVLTVLGWFTADYMDLQVVEEGVRMISVFLYPNAFGCCAGICVLLGLGLAGTSGTAGARAGHLVCLAVNALSFILVFSMGACIMIVPAFLVLLVLTGKPHRMGLFLLMAETLAVTMLSAFPISMTSMTAWDGFRPIPLICTVAGAVALCALDLLAGRRIADRLRSHGKIVLCLIVAALIMLIMFITAACTLTGGAALRPGESLRRSAYPKPGTYVLTVQTDGEPSVTIQSQNREETIMHTYTVLYRGPVSQAKFTVPEDSLVVWFRFSAKEETRLESAEYRGESGSGSVPLGYRLLPGFIANRLQGIRANQNAIQRFAFFEDGLTLFRRSPVIGLGLGGFANAVNGVQSFYYFTKYAHSHYIQALAETGIIGLALFLGLLVVSAVSVWRGREQPMAPALGAALAFLAGHSAVEGTLSHFASLPMAFGLFAAISLCSGDAFPLPAWAEKKAVHNGLAVGMCAMLAVFGVLLGCNIAALNIADSATELEQLEQAAALDPFEYADHLLTYVMWAGEMDADGEIRQKADEYAARLEKFDSNSIPFYLAKYYLETGRAERGLEMAERYVNYVSADLVTWQDTFHLLEEYETDTEAFRAGVLRIADLLDKWNLENIGHIELDEQSLAFIERMRS